MEIRAISWEQTLPLRQSVLWPNKPSEFCHVEGDSGAMHFGAFTNDQLVCVASVYLDANKARLRKFATHTEYQGQGIGSKMLTYILHSLKDTDAKVFWCDARESALGFYQRFGMRQCGERFYKADITYFKMEVSL
ncbi:GNAT family N-acetyltransferase [Reinekea marina]|uniref:GNAT family N-acetyltransferase n=1 Tax=Reinekea marina TaxID=1310421 RepID=A0ABV7WUA1_9GAMM|nr:GNAT family N-acetyltransferase [Reinekea marina]MDN3650908.1 GNAT family N-acetyltransferase [Reinekea marina]